MAIGAMVCLLTALWVQLSVSAGSGWLHNALRHHWLMPISCHFRDCKALLDCWTRVLLVYKRLRRYNKCPDLYFYLYLQVSLVFVEDRLNYNMLKAATPSRGNGV